MKNVLKITLYTSLFFLMFFELQAQNAESFISSNKSEILFELTSSDKEVIILFDKNDFAGVNKAVNQLQKDFETVTNQKAIKVNHLSNNPIKIIIGTYAKSSYITQIIDRGLIKKEEIEEKNEKFIIQTLKEPLNGIDEALVICGSDMRGTIYGIYELSRQMGVSPWYYWADIPIVHRTNIYIRPGKFTASEPAVTYRGIFINDEAPALSRWSNYTFGGFNHQFYEKVFELILRLKGNLFWPAMWGSAFYDDDQLNGPLADEMGIIIGTSHHEPIGRAHDEWRRYGTGEWNYVKNKEELNHFWEEGFKRMKDYEKVVTLGMRGDGDEPMSEANDINLLEKIITDQREIIKKVSKDNINKTPQVWSLYKEVQDYYDKGMLVPDDVTLLLCDDNWGDVRKLPSPDSKKREGGYGMYYHFDYVGGPRNYKWLNVSQIQRVWEQMNLTYSHGVDKLWIVNVGDIKPMEYPISFFLDMAWNPDQFNPHNLLEHTEKWCEEQFGKEFAETSAHLINMYTKYSHRITPELLNDTIYSLENYNEFETVLNDYRALALDAFRVYQQLPAETKDAFDQLVLFPINASSNLHEMYFAVAKNKQMAKKGNLLANFWADKVKESYDRDSLLTIHYNEKVSDGKWNHMMDQIRIGYTYWQQPEKRVMPDVIRISEEAPGLFIEKEGYISIEAEHFNRSKGTKSIYWDVIPNLGKTLSGVTTFPSNEYPSQEDKIYLEYDFVMESSGEFPIHIFVSPTLNFNENKGLRYAISIDENEEQIVNINQTYDVKQMEQWQANRINKTVTNHKFSLNDKHTLRIRVLDPGIVLQKIIIDTGGLKKTYLGAPESEKTKVKWIKSINTLN